MHRAASALCSGWLGSVKTFACAFGRHMHDASRWFYTLNFDVLPSPMAGRSAAGTGSAAAFLRGGAAAGGPGGPSP